MIKKFKFFEGISEDIYVFPTHMTYNQIIQRYHRPITVSTITEPSPMLWYSSSSLAITDDYVENLINQV